ncbi:hypothetical protein Tco_0397654 [Tanacetum coccineum]
MTMEEYIKLEKEKARRRDRVFNWQTATYGKIRVDDDLYDLRSMEAEFPAIVIDDAFTPQDALPCKSQVSTPVKDEIDFRISFDKSDDEDYTIICDKNSFSYKMNSINNLKTDSENDNENADIPSFPLPKPTTMSEYDEEEQNILYFNDLFPFNIIRPDDLKLEKDNNDNDINIIQSLEDMAPLPPRQQRYLFLRYQGLEYTDEDIADFEERLERIYSRQIHRLGEARRRLSWMQFILALGLHTEDEMESLSFARYWSESDRMIPEKGDLHDYWRGISTDGDFLGPPPSYISIRDPVLRLYHRMMAHNIAGRSQAPEKRFAAGRKSMAHISGGQFVARLAEHFGLLTTEILGGLTVIAPELLIIDMGELVRLQICMEVDDTWAWVAIGLERQPEAVAGTPAVVEDAPAADEGDQAVLAPVQAPQQLPPPPPAAARTMPQRLGRLEEEVQGLCRDVGSLHGLMERSMTDQGRFSTCMMSYITQFMDASGLTYQAFDGTFRGSSPAAFQRRTSASQQDPQ